ncbi:hypothetical protein AXL1_17 [Stenotrophomonas phage vB_SmaS-AXL_1]|uniref:hypothetical protein n=1 Tax=Stenotrophomonas phage vB_SmaS-AXL_1 TaxID=2909581 RepID=UPI002409CA2C|nr:hypothetical protein P9A52_gp17 [Stenotrophomonas phage vB_SmaS-AXL_1]UIS24787.1 hypothetical protein AXL1_17 [Stenotrophomonas phage vB_SmaS-AXL_1]
MADPLEAGPEWEGKMSFAPGVPEDPDAIPELFYQVLLGRVYTLTRWKDGSTARGEVQLADLEAVAGGAITREGWYDALGAYLGAELPGSL